METKYKIHAFYILAILSTIIIVLVAVKWAAIPNLVDLITFSLTITSLALSGLAIIYAFVSNGAFQGTIMSLNKTSEEMSKSGDRIGTVLTAFEEKLDNIPTLLKEVEGKVSKTHDMIESFSKTPTENTPPAVEDIKNQTATQLVTEVINRYVLFASVSGLKTAYAFGLAHQKAHPLNLKALCETQKYVTYDYAHGFAVATAGVGLLDYDQRSDIFTVTIFNPDLFGLVEKELKVRRERFPAEQQALFDADIVAIQTYFSSTPLDTSAKEV